MWRRASSRFKEIKEIVYATVPDTKASSSVIHRKRLMGTIAPEKTCWLERTLPAARWRLPRPAPWSSKAKRLQSLRSVVGMDIRFMVGCDQSRVFPDDDEGPAAAGPAAAGPPMAALPPAAAVDDAPPPPAPPVDPDDITKLNVRDVASLSLPAQDYVADNFRAQHSAHAGLLLCFMSPEVEAAFPEQAQALYAGFQEVYQHPAKVEDVRCYPSVGCNAYNEEEVQWFEATYDYLEGQLDDAELAKRMLPTKKQRRSGRSATSAPAAPAVPSLAAAAGPRTTPRAARADDMENDN